jgi:hypothetical protein
LEGFVSLKPLDPKPPSFEDHQLTAPIQQSNIIVRFIWILLVFANEWPTLLSSPFPLPLLLPSFPLSSLVSSLSVFCLLVRGLTSGVVSFSLSRKRKDFLFWQSDDNPEGSSTEMMHASLCMLYIDRVLDGWMDAGCMLNAC